MLRILRYNRPKREKIDDPLRFGEIDGSGQYHLVQERSFWAPWVCCHTTGQFSQVAGIRYYNNCGPTALTNLVCMYRARFLLRKDNLADAREIYGYTAPYGSHHLFYVNRNNRFLHGSSDIRCGRYIRKIFRKLLDVRPKIRLSRMTAKNIRSTIDRKGLLYLMLWGHPEYGSHHLIGHGYRILRSETGQDKTFLAISDGHNASIRYLDMDDFRNCLAFYREIVFPKDQ